MACRCVCVFPGWWWYVPLSSTQLKVQMEKTGITVQANSSVSQRIIGFEAPSALTHSWWFGSSKRIILRPSQVKYSSNECVSRSHLNKPIHFLLYMLFNIGCSKDTSLYFYFFKQNRMKCVSGQTIFFIYFFATMKYVFYADPTAIAYDLMFSEEKEIHRVPEPNILEYLTPKLFLSLHHLR